MSSRSRTQRKDINIAAVLAGLLIKTIDDPCRHRMPAVPEMLSVAHVSGPEWTQDCMAVRQGFEPWRLLPAYTRSRRAPSTTRPPHREMKDPLYTRGGLPRKGAIV